MHSKCPLNVPTVYSNDFRFVMPICKSKSTKWDKKAKAIFNSISAIPSFNTILAEFKIGLLYDESSSSNQIVE